MQAIDVELNLRCSCGLVMSNLWIGFADGLVMMTKQDIN